MVSSDVFPIEMFVPFLGTFVSFRGCNYRQLFDNWDDHLFSTAVSVVKLPMVLWNFHPGPDGERMQNLMDAHIFKLGGKKAPSRL